MLLCSITFLHNKDVEGDVVHLSWKGINSTQQFSCLVCELITHFCLNIPGPVPALLYQCRSKQRHQPRFLNSIRPSNMQKPLSNMMTQCPLVWMCRLRRSFPAKIFAWWEWAVVPIWLPSTSSNHWYRIWVWPQQMVWYLFPIVLGVAFLEWRSIQEDRRTSMSKCSWTHPSKQDTCLLGRIKTVVILA